MSKRIYTSILFFIVSTPIFAGSKIISRTQFVGRMGEFHPASNPITVGFIKGTKWTHDGDAEWGQYDRGPFIRAKIKLRPGNFFSAFVYKNDNGTEWLRVYSKKPRKLTKAERCAYIAKLIQIQELEAELEP